MEVNENDLSSDEETPLPPPHFAGDNSDWEYAMRREMQEILPRLFLGPYAAAMKSKLEKLQSAGITHIVCIRQSIEANFVRPNFPQHFRYLVLDIADSPTENIIRHFKQTKEFIDDCICQGGKVLVHGNGGISRSAAVVIAYVMEKCSLTCNAVYVAKGSKNSADVKNGSFSQLNKPVEAVAYVRNKRFCISVNDGFLHQLSEYEHIYKAQSLVKIPDASAQPSNLLKRKRIDMDMDVSPTSQPCTAASAATTDS